MSRSRNKSNKSNAVSTNNSGPKPLGSDDFISLNYLPAGTDKVADIADRQYKDTLRKVTVTEIKNETDNPDQQSPDQRLNINDELRDVVLEGIDHILKAIENKVLKGRYGKVAKSMYLDMVKDFISIFTYDDEPSTEDMATAEKIINIGKSFYEYADDKRFISDSLYDELLASYKEHGGVEPTGIVPAGNQSAQKVDAVYKTLANNVDKAYIVNSDDQIPEGVEEKGSVEAFLENAYHVCGLKMSDEMELELSPKIDGVSINGTIVNGRLHNPQSRGTADVAIAINGLHGVELCSDPKGLPDNFGCQFEVFVTLEDRVKASEYLKLDKPYIGCRQAAAGITHRLATNKDPALVKYLSFYPIATEDVDGTYAERLDMIQKLAVVPSDMLDRKTIKGDFKRLLAQIEKTFETVTKKRENLSYIIDGMVITVKSDGFQSNLGRNGRTNKFQVALKFAPCVADAIVDHLELESGLKGYRTIQVYLKHPVFFDDGIKYDHVPVLTHGIFENMGLCEENHVNVHRVGDVIPSITKVDDGNGTKLEAPKVCQTCGHALIIKAKKLYCQNSGCKDNIVGRLVTFFQVLGLDDYSDSFARKLHDAGINHPASIVTEVDEDFLTDHEITGALAAAFPERVRKAMEHARDYEVIAAIAMPGIGSENAKLLIRCAPFECWTKSLSEIREVGCQLTKHTGTLAASALLKAVEHEAGWLAKLLPYVKNHTTNLEMLRVGHSGGAPSKELAAAIRDMGYDLVDNKKFDVLLVPSYDYVSEKTKLAKNKGIPIVRMEDYLRDCQSFIPGSEGYVDFKTLPDFVQLAGHRAEKIIDDTRKKISNLKIDKDVRHIDNSKNSAATVVESAW